MRACQSFCIHASFTSPISLDADYSGDLWAIFRFLLSFLEAEKINLKVGAILGAEMIIVVRRNVIIGL